MNACKSIALALIAVGVLADAADKKPVSRSESVQVTATVESIDHAQRTAVLKGQSGEQIVVVAGPEVRNFDRVKKGDRVMLTYIVGLAAQVKPRGTPLSAPVDAVTEKRSPPGQNPSAAVGRTVFTTIKIDSVDTSFNTVTFKRADGITRTIGVDDPEAQRFIRTLKPGDTVEIAYTEALAVSLEPTAAK